MNINFTIPILLIYWVLVFAGAIFFGIAGIIWDHHENDGVPYFLLSCGMGIFFQIIAASII
jgi:hypothetical protein